MARRRIYDQELFAHFITFSCYRRRKLLDFDHPKRILLGVLHQQLSKQSATCVGFVIMPDHVHALVWFPETGQLSRFMHGWKRGSSYEVRNWYRNQPTNYQEAFREQEPFWQPKYYSFEVFSSSKMKEKLDYMHLNPVRAEFVQKTVDWRWSSARYYELDQSVGVPVKWVE